MREYAEVDRAPLSIFVQLRNRSAMTTAALKKKIKALVETTTDEKKLGKALDVLSKETKAEAIQRRMQEVTEESERDIRAGRTLSLDEFIKDSDAFIKDLFKEKGTRRAAASRKAGAVKSAVKARRSRK